MLSATYYATSEEKNLEKSPVITQNDARRGGFDHQPSPRLRPGRRITRITQIRLGDAYVISLLNYQQRKFRMRLSYRVQILSDHSICVNDNSDATQFFMHSIRN